MAIGAGRSGNQPRVPVAGIPISTRNTYVFPPLGTSVASHANPWQPGMSGPPVSSPPHPLTLTIAVVSTVSLAVAGLLASTSICHLTALAKTGLPAR